MADAPLAEVLARFRELNARGRRHLIGMRLPVKPSMKLTRDQAVPRELEPAFGGRKPYWRTFEDFERDIIALNDRLAAEGKSAKIHTWLPFGDDARG